MCVRGRTRSVPEADARGEPRHRETELLERRREERVLLEAVAATATRDELRLQAREVEPDRTAEQDVEVLEGDRRRVREMQRVERCAPGREAALVADALEVARQVERVGFAGV